MVQVMTTTFIFTHRMIKRKIKLKLFNLKSRPAFVFLNKTARARLCVSQHVPTYSSSSSKFPLCSKLKISSTQFRNVQIESVFLSERD